MRIGGRVGIDIAVGIDGLERHAWSPRGWLRGV
jgi:hypothetical protein